MTFRQIIILLSLGLFFSCKKDVICEGVVLSKHNYPVPNVMVKMGLFKNPDDPTENGFVGVTTDINGRFKITGQAKRKYPVNIKCTCDSGTFASEKIYNRELTNYVIDLK